MAENAEVDIVVRARDEASAEINSIGERLKGMSTQLRVAGAAMTAVGVAGLKMVSDSKKMNAALGQTALTIGVSTKEMRNLALSVTNVTFPLDSVISTFDLLTRAGVRDTEMLKASANAFDALADATGSSAEVLAGALIPAFKVFGIELPTTAEEMDKFTWLTKNTTVELSDFASVMDYVALFGADLNVTLEDMIAIMAALEAKGITGSAATRAFRTAVTEAAKEGKSLAEVLNITQPEIDGFKASMDGAAGITNKYADVANKQYSIMDKIKQKWSEITLAASGFLEPLEPILALMTAMGPVMILLSTTAGTKLVGSLGKLATSFIAMGMAALRALGHLIMTAAAQIWAWASAIPFGWLLAIAGVAALTASIWGIKTLVGSLSGMAEGGVIREPTLLIGLQSRRPYAIAGERGPEIVSPMGAAGVTIHIAQLVVREEADVPRIARELLRLQQLRTKNV